MVGPLRETPLQLVRRLTASELDSLRDNVSAGRVEIGLKALDERGAASELVRDQYTGRYPLELIQNANDAAVGDGAVGGRVKFVLTRTALVVADQGAGFAADQVRAICGLARSSKDPRKSVGYKGLGFKSVGEITDTPQVISGELWFGFDPARLRREIGSILKGPLPVGLRVPDYAFPFEIGPDDLGEDKGEIEELLADGFQTVMRLPFRAPEDRSVVERHVVETVVPRLLLFLDAATSLELEGTQGAFTAEAIRESHDGYDELLLQAGKRTEHFLVFRREAPIEDSSLVAALGGAWSQVEAVRLAVAVPLGLDGNPTGGEAEPLHVYFPTEEETGISLILNADFQMELDRRRISRTVQSEAYNLWLVRELADFLAHEVVPRLAQQFEGHGVLDVLAPHGQGSGWGAHLMDRLFEALREEPFVRCRDSHLRRPSEARLLPRSVPDPGELHRWLYSEPAVVIPAAEQAGYVRTLLADRLGVPELPVQSVLRSLEPPEPREVEAYYLFLLKWSNVAPRSFVSALGDTRCISLWDNDWVRPNEGTVFLPPQRGETDFPSELQLPIAQLPKIDGLAKLLEEAGVEPLTWRALVADFLMPRLSDPACGEGDRLRAIQALRTYYERVRRGDAGDQEIRQAVPETLLPARDARSASVGLRAARELYFGADWIPDGGLETLYGPFEDHDFLAVPRGDSYHADIEFYRWLGVSEFPKVVDANPWDAAYAGWRSSAEFRRNRQCLSGAHPNSQVLDSMPTLDRLPQILNSDNRDRLSALWILLAENWENYRKHILRANWRCVAAAHHTVARNRSLPSPAVFLLSGRAWVPAERAGESCQATPDRVWRSMQGVPRDVAKHLFVVSRGLPRPKADLASDLGMLDVVGLSAPDLVDLLTDFEADFEDAATLPAGVVDGAQWILRRIEEAKDLANLEPGTVPLISRIDGSYRFARNPYLVNNAVFAEVWGDAVATYAGDRDLDRVLGTLGILVLDEQVVVDPICGDRQPELEEDVVAQLAEAAPALIALAARDVPSRVDEIAQRLRGISVVCSGELLLQYALTGFEPRIDERASAFIDDAGTAYLQTDGVEPDWPSLALRLAEHLEVEAGDAFAFVLTADRRSRDGFLRAHRISHDDLLAAAESFQADPEPDESTTEDLPTSLEAQEIGRERLDQNHPNEPSVSKDVAVPDEDPPEENPVPRAERAQVDATKEGTRRSAGAARGTNNSPMSPAGRHDGSQEDGSAQTKGARSPQVGERAAAHSTTQHSGTPRSSKSGTEDHSRFYSYVVARGSREARMAERAESEAMRIGAQGVEHVVAFEATYGRAALPQHHSNKGFDVISTYPDGTERRVIEVKATARGWPTRGIPVSKHQVQRNVESGDEFWLYIVEFAMDPERVRVIPIQNPVAAVDYYVFDPGWEKHADRSAFDGHN